jgi:hypothetical protein
MGLMFIIKGFLGGMGWEGRMMWAVWPVMLVIVRMARKL